MGLCNTVVGSPGLEGEVVYSDYGYVVLDWTAYTYVMG